MESKRAGRIGMRSHLAVCFAFLPGVLKISEHLSELRCWLCWVILKGSDIFERGQRGRGLARTARDSSLV